jgi:hypothetical protein
MGQQSDTCATIRLNKCPIFGKQKELTYSTARGKTDMDMFFLKSDLSDISINCSVMLKV